jgi:hypothetical protein
MPGSRTPCISNVAIECCAYITRLRRPNRTKELAESSNQHPSYCAMFKFVTVSHPDEIKDRKKQGKLRQHAIRNGIQRSKADKAKRDGIFVSVQIDANTGQTVKRLLPKVDNLTNTPSISLLDPFNTLCECPERLRKLMRHRAYLSPELSKNV